MTDKVQKIREEVEKLKSQLLRGACSSQIAMETRCKEEAYNEVLAILDTIQEEPVSEDLKEEITRYFSKNPIKHLTDWPALKNTALHFANWQKEQLMANTADAMIGLPYENKDGGYTHLIDVSRPLPVGNNKIAIIFKED